MCFWRWCLFSVSTVSFIGSLLTPSFQIVFSLLYFTASFTQKQNTNFRPASQRQRCVLKHLIFPGNTCNMTFLLVLTGVLHGEVLTQLKEWDRHSIITISPKFVKLAEIFTCKEKQKTLGSNMGAPSNLATPLHLHASLHLVWLLPPTYNGLNKRTIQSFSVQYAMSELFERQRQSSAYFSLRTAVVWDATKCR